MTMLELLNKEVGVQFKFIREKRVIRIQEMVDEVGAVELGEKDFKNLITELMQLCFLLQQPFQDSAEALDPDNYGGGPDYPY